ncbi:allene oxide synthase-lipoxygenase protein-like [Clavelina lepadiformis]|uniref:allene oxide synthase-lipoxygenase protein-like n=1 Tax=Clavelina lepadiformis TaxID=159417 RepID=UPI00404132A9
MGIIFSRRSEFEEVDVGKTWYRITTQTSHAYSKAGTKSKVSVNLLGKNGIKSTGYFELGNNNKFQAGKLEHFDVLVDDVGLPVIVKIQLADQSKVDEWFCDQITVNLIANGLQANFPVHDWVLNGTEVTRGDAVLPQKITDPYVQSLRKREIENNLSLFQWIARPNSGDSLWGLPRFVDSSRLDTLPLLFKRMTARQIQRDKNYRSIGVQLLLNKIITCTCPMNSLQSYHKMAEGYHLERQNLNYLDDWDTDEGMGRQVLTGINPLMVSRCTSLPDYFNVTNDDVKGFLSSNRMLEEEIQAGKIYISDYKELLEGVERNVVNGKELYCPDAVGLFYVNDEGKFLPIAIQLVPGDRGYLFTPEDNNRWLLAKMYFRCAGSSQHLWVNHFLVTHGVMEPFSVAIFRCLPRPHPVYKLLRPHLQTVSAINHEAREILIRPESPGNQIISVCASALVRKTFETLTLDDLHIPNRLKKQGIDDPSLLPNNYYRDDALALWKIMDKFVGSVLRYYYKSDADVYEDHELQTWAEDVAKSGLGWHDDNTRGMPTRITTVDKLVEICLILMFTSSVQHAAVNFGQFQNYKFVPNSPSSMRLPPPKKTETVTDELIMESLPGANVAMKAAAFTFALSAFYPDEIYLGQYPDRLFNDIAVLEMMEEYRQALAEVSRKIRKRNESLKHPYTFLLPEFVPNNIAI